MDKNSIQDYISQDSELDPFAAFGLFMTNQDTSINPAQGNTNPTTDMLYRISHDVYTRIRDQEIKYKDNLKKLKDVYNEQYQNIVRRLKDDKTSRKDILDYVSQSTKYNDEQKRKPDEITEDDLDEGQRASQSTFSSTIHNLTKKNPKIQYLKYEITA